MSQAGPEMEKMLRVRDELAARFGDHPDVRLIDIGYVYEGDKRTQQLAVRIHMRERPEGAPEGQEIVPESVDGIPVVVMVGDYRLEGDG